MDAGRRFSLTFTFLANACAAMLSDELPEKLKECDLRHKEFRTGGKTSDNRFVSFIRRYIFGQIKGDSLVKGDWSDEGMKQSYVRLYELVQCKLSEIQGTSRSLNHLEDLGSKGGEALAQIGRDVEIMNDLLLGFIVASRAYQTPADKLFSVAYDIAVRFGDNHGHRQDQIDRVCKDHFNLADFAREAKIDRANKYLVQVDPDKEQLREELTATKQKLLIANQRLAEIAQKAVKAE